MSFVGKSPKRSRFFAAISLLCYLLAGASLALPAKPANAHCAMTHVEDKPETLQPGTSCPHLSQGSGQHSHHQSHNQSHNQSHASHDCPICHDQQPAGQIVMCPQGCCLLYPEGGEVTSIAKFVLDPVTLVAVRDTLEQIFEPPQSAVPEPFRAPPDRPPAAPFLV